ncbi:hypothetical protein E2C01_038799 [Portunus trituberculatus]|uniref:Secreted protein n=1 Tax=Portunus trituberculatus TaxID=210409 RepID=A0A5B7FL13_PORTR|nr:hypothetical protein [Portunus trituberculatus]
MRRREAGNAAVLVIVALAAVGQKRESGGIRPTALLRSSDYRRVRTRPHDHYPRAPPRSGFISWTSSPGWLPRGGR